MEIISAGTKSNIASQKNWAIYNNLIKQFNNEFKILLETPIAQIKNIAGDKIADFIEKNRLQKIKFQPGYDGEYGKPLFDDSEKLEIKFKPSQKSLSDF